MERTIRVLIADDHAVYRWGLRTLLDSEPDMEVVGEAATGKEVIERPPRSAQMPFLWIYRCQA